MNVIDNTNLLQMCRDCGAVGFVPSLSYVYDADAATVAITNASTIPAGDTLQRIKVRVHDFFGGEVRGVIDGTHASPQTIDVSTLNRSKPLTITATIMTTNHIHADGGVYGYISAAGSVGSWDVQKNA